MSTDVALQAAPLLPEDILRLTLDVLRGPQRILDRASAAAGDSTQLDRHQVQLATIGLQSGMAHSQTLQRLSSGSWAVADEPLCPRSLVEKVIQEARTQPWGPHHLHSQLPETLPDRIYGDPARLRSALGAVLSFALANSSSGHIEVGALWDGSGSTGTAVFYVHDATPGLFPAPQKGSLTDVILRNEDHLKSHRLGLEVAERLMSSLQGRLVTETDRLGGLIFRMEFPSRVPRTEAAPAQHRRTGALDVLLVEDNPVNQEVGRVILEYLGCSVWTASDGVEATILLEHGQFDMIFMDLNMPRMDGLAATRWLRQAEGRGPFTPIIAVTASVRPGTREECLRAGMNDFIAKPISTASIKRAIARWSPRTPVVERAS